MSRRRPASAVTRAWSSGDGRTSSLTASGITSFSPAISCVSSPLTSALCHFRSIGVLHEDYHPPRYKRGSILCGKCAANCAAEYRHFLTHTRPTTCSRG